ncbi:mutS protein homolog 4 isoform X3 [Lasioglossum baleicum]|uniref:mutS protein homolog 4 isoform X3 n=1 Tax=Lasioglossum baleicum TaxID=434251 RepID=UPI003FCDDBD7
MNVMQTEKLFQPPREKLKNEMNAREQPFAVPFTTKYQSRPNTNNRITTTKQIPTSSNYSRSSNRGRNVRRVRGSTSSSALAGCSRNYIPRSARSSKTTTGVGTSTYESGGVVLAITGGRGDARAEVGLAALDIRCPHLILCQISDIQTYTNTLTKLYLFDPIQVLMPDTMCEPVPGRNMLYHSIIEKFPEIQPTPISRIHFNDTVGLERVRTLCAGEYSSVELFVKHKYYALAAAAALLKYIEYSQRIVYSPKSIRIEFQGSPNATCIDLESARSLELVQSQSGQRNVSLLGVLDHCSTPMGRKLLRANILQPPCEQRVIVDRQSSVAELVSNRALRIVLQPIVRRLYGADRLAALSTTPVLHGNSVQCAEHNLNYVLLLKNMLDTVPELEEALSTAETDHLRQIRKRLGNPRFQQMRERIFNTIHPDATFVVGYTSSNMQRCFAIKAGINDLLDVARRTYCELIDDMKSMVENLASRYKLPLSLGCNATQGFHVQAILPRNSNDFQLPIEFIEVRKSRRVYTMTTSALTTLSQQCKIASDELHLMSNVLLCDLLQSIREYIGCLFQLNTDTAELDVISSLAQTSSLLAYVRPMFGSKLELLDSRHPILEAFGLDDPVPNNVCASTPWNFHMISGPNMSGKSTYLNHCFETISTREQEASTNGEDSSRYTYTHRLKPGVASTDDYGIVLAELSGLPKSVTKQARNYTLEQQMTTINRTSSESSNWERACYRIVAEMYQLFEGEDGKSVRRETLGEYIERMRNLGVPGANENNEQRVEGTTNDVNDANDTSNSNRVYAETTVGDQARRLNDSTTKSNFEEIQDLELDSDTISHLDRLTCDHESICNDAVSIRSCGSQTIERIQFRMTSSSFCGSDRYRDRDPDTSTQQSFNMIAIESSHFGSPIHANIPAKIRDLNTVDSLKTRLVDNLEETNNSINEAALSLSFTSVCGSPVMDRSESRLSNLHEYCLSDSDFDVELCENSPPFTPTNESHM